MKKVTNTKPFMADFLPDTFQNFLREHLKDRKVTQKIKKKVTEKVYICFSCFSCLLCVKSIQIQSFSGLYFPAFELNTEKCGPEENSASGHFSGSANIS